jgi:hypothetical protein
VHHMHSPAQYFQQATQVLLSIRWSLAVVARIYHIGNIDVLFKSSLISSYHHLMVSIPPTDVWEHYVTMSVVI